MELDINLDMRCCGTMEISGISRASSGKTVVNALLDQCEPSEIHGFVIFTSSRNGKGAPPAYGERLMRYIEENNLGTVTRSVLNRNQNTEHYVTVYVWAVNHKAIRALYDKTCASRESCDY